MLRVIVLLDLYAERIAAEGRFLYVVVREVDIDILVAFETLFQLSDILLFCLALEFILRSYRKTAFVVVGL